MRAIQKFIVLITLVVPTLAMAAPPSAAVREACSGDAKRLCSAVISQTEARQACMRKHRAQLSERCKAAIAKSR